MTLPPEDMPEAKLIRQTEPLAEDFNCYLQPDGRVLWTYVVCGVNKEAYIIDGKVVPTHRLVPPRMTKDVDLPGALEFLQQMLINDNAPDAPVDTVDGVQHYLHALYENCVQGDNKQGMVRFMAEVCTYLVEETIELTIEAEELRHGAPSKIWVEGEEI